MTSLLSGVSVVVCCRNGEARIGRCLEHLLKLASPGSGLPIEILLVDNGSTDGTLRVAHQMAPKFDVHSLNVLHETRAGTAFARETGILAARYDVLIFCDDDNLLNSDYAQIAWQLIQDHPDVAIVGGNSVAECEVELPDWFASLSGQYAVQYVDYSGPLGMHTNHWTAGMACRTEVLQRLIQSGFRPIGSTGLPGFSGSCGEDTELCWAVRHWNWSLYYEGRLCFTHVIAAERLTRRYLVRQAENFGAASLAWDGIKLTKACSWKNRVRTQVWYQILRASVSLIAVLPEKLLENAKSPFVSRWHARLGRLRALWLNRKCYCRLVKQYANWYEKNQPLFSGHPWLGD